MLINIATALLIIIPYLSIAYVSHFENLLVLPVLSIADAEREAVTSKRQRAAASRRAKKPR